MHEFRFSLVYEEGADAYADAFIADESLRSEGVYSCLDPGQLWRLEAVTGDPDALDGVEGLLFDESLDTLSISDRDCGADRAHSLLTDDPRRRVVYSYFGNVAHCDAVPVIAAQYVTGGLLVERTKRGHEARWRVLLQNDEKVGMLYDTLGARLGEGVSFEFGHLTEVDGWESRLLSPRSLPGEQLEVLTLAVEAGYFETPREVTLDELADELGVPRSTVSYRLRRATAELATAFVENR
jgi:hypothetical protein